MNASSDGLPKGLVLGDDGKARCFWHGGKEDYLRYHDEEWGMPVEHDHQLFEKICLEGFRIVLADDPTETREFPFRFCRF